MKPVLQLLRPAVLLVSTTLAFVVPAFAEDESEGGEDSEGVEQILVTAERRESLAQKTPVAVSVFTGSMLDDRGYYDFEDVSLEIPNVQFGRTLVGSGGVTIRGVASSAGDRATAFHTDGIYINSAGAAEGLTFFDVQRVEVLRGPQGTLYGRNATGGSINVISKAPGPELEAFGDVQFGEYDQTLWRGALNVPILSERLFARVSLFGESRDGYQKNVAPKDKTITWDGSPTRRDDADDSQRFGLRSQLRWLPSDTLDLTLRYKYAQRKGVGDAQKVLGDFPDSVTVADVPPTLVIADQYCTSAAAMMAGCDVTSNPSGNRNIALDLIGDVDSRENSVNGQLVWDLPELSWAGETRFKLLGSYLRGRGYGLSDQDGSDGNLVNVFTAANTTFERIPDPDPNAPPGATVLVTDEGCNTQAFANGATAEEAGCTPGHDKLTEKTVEIQWSNLGGAELEWVVGAFYLASKSNTNVVATTMPLPWVLPGSQFEVAPGVVVPVSGAGLSFVQVPVLTTATARAQSVATFGQADYHFGRDTGSIWDDWTATLGLRYTYDWKKGVRKTPRVSVLGQPVQGEIDTSDSERWSSVTGTARLHWDWREENSAYFSVSRGYKAGFINTALLDDTDSTTSFPNADPEYIWAYELGSKNRFWDDRLQANVTGFYYDYQDLQVSQLKNISVVTQNASDATIWGFEAELIAKPLEGYVPDLLDGFTVIFNAGYLDTEYDDFEDCALPEAGAFIDCSGRTLVRAPEYTFSVIVDWPLDLGRYGTLTPNAQLYASGEVFFRPANCPNADCEAAIDAAFPPPGTREQNQDAQRPYEIWDARLTWTSSDRHVAVTGFIQNILDKDVIQSQVVGSSQIGSPIQVRFDRPRTWGARIALAW